MAVSLALISCMYTIPHQFYMTLTANSDVKCLPAADAELWTTGSNDSGQLGHKGHDTQLQPSRVQALDAHGVCQIACGQQHMLAVADQGALCAWGAADLGQLGMHFSVCPSHAKLANRFFSVSKSIAMCCARSHQAAPASHFYCT